MYINIELLPLYDDEYGRIGYDDYGDIAAHNTQGSVTSRGRNGQLARL